MFNNQDREQRYWSLLDKLNDRMGKVETDCASILARLDSIDQNLLNATKHSEMCLTHDTDINSHKEEISKIQEQLTWYNRYFIGITVSIILGLLTAVYHGVTNDSQPSSSFAAKGNIIT
jgi:hypothetical protein